MLQEVLGTRQQKKAFRKQSKNTAKNCDLSSHKGAFIFLQLLLFAYKI